MEIRIPIKWIIYSGSVARDRVQPPEHFPEPTR
jgi:hypothetical protein